MSQLSRSARTTSSCQQTIITCLVRPINECRSALYRNVYRPAYWKPSSCQFLHCIFFISHSLRQKFFMSRGIVAIKSISLRGVCGGMCRPERERESEITGVGGLRKKCRQISKGRIIYLCIQGCWWGSWGGSEADGRSGSVISGVAAVVNVRSFTLLHSPHSW